MTKFRPEEWKERNRFSTLPVEKKMRIMEKHKAYMKRLPEERRKKYHKTAMTNYINKLKQTNPAKWDQMMEKNRNKIAEETPEERQKRLLRYKVYQAKRKARVQLEVEGILTNEELERRLEEVVSQVEEKDRLERERKPVDPAEYKPRENARKPKKNQKCFDKYKENRNYPQELHCSSSLLPKEQNPPEQVCASFSFRQDNDDLKMESEPPPISPPEGESI
ncbi:unnamed protein product [Orchesella dallaii]|uniref:Uncharacterized protein n=1 Tax=Orchesella dallaii TaxID=48710 RepID=A0ABP1PK90_9HEXA